MGASFVNVWQAIDAALSKHPEREFMGAKHTNASGEWSPYEWMTFGQARDTIETLATRFAGWGIAKGEHAAIVASNSPEWVCTICFFMLFFHTYSRIALVFVLMSISC